MTEPYYTIIHDESQIRRYVNMFMETNDKAVMLLGLMVRTKHMKKKGACYKMSRAFFERKCLTLYATKCPADLVIRTLRRYEVKQGLYVDDNGVPLDNDALSVYVMFHPRNVVQTKQELVDQWTTSAFHLINNPTQSNIELNKQPVSQVLSKLQKYSLNRRVICLDLDDKKYFQDVMSRLSVESIEPLFVIETHGGYHIYIKQTEQHLVIHKLSDEFKMSVLRDPLSPMPGTYQSGFPVKFIDNLN